MTPPIRPRGFALVLTFIIAAMALLLAMTAAVILKLELAVAASGSAHARARLSARAALRMALGEMQGAVGPDRRVTADAGLTDRDAAPGGVSLVWRSNRFRHENPDAPPFVHRDRNGALRDRRDAVYDATTEVLRALVSEGDRRDWRRAAMMRLPEVYAGSPTSAPRVDSPGNDFAFAWAAIDEGVKWRVTPEPRERKFSAVVPSGSGASAIAGWRRAEERPSPMSRRLADVEITGLLEPGAAWKTESWLTSVSSGVAANTLAGGLRRDLTPFLLSTGFDAPIRDTDPLIVDPGVSPGPFAEAGPRFGMLRAWAKLGGTATASGTIVPSGGTRYHDVGDAKPAARFHSGTHPDLPEMLAPTAPVVAPVLSEAAVFLRLSGDDSRRDKDGVPTLRLHLHPRVTLWNPYAATLAPARYLVHLRIGGSPVFRLVRAGKNLIGAISGWRVYENAIVNYAVTQGTLLFVLDCPPIPAGESRLFVPSASAPLYGKTPESKIYDPVANVLRASDAPHDASFYLTGFDAFEDAGVKALAGVSLKSERWRIERSSAEDFAMSLSFLPPGEATWRSLLAAPTLRYVSVSVKAGAGTTPVAGMPPGRDEPLRPDTDAPPPAGSRDGIRLRRFFEPAGNAAAFAPRGFADIATTGDYSPIAPFSFLHPFENATAPASSAVRSAEFFGLFTRDNPDAETDAVAYAPVAGVAAHPFGLPSTFPGVARVVIAGFPKNPSEAGNWADFADAPLSPFAWHPARLPGESGVPPAAPRDATANDSGNAAWSTTGPGRALLEHAMRFGESPESPRVADMRYELNHAVWDRYVFVTGDRARRESFAANPDAHPLPNDRWRTTNGFSLEALLGPDAADAATSGLMIAGAFNVNSTSVEAWKQWLLLGRGLSPDAAFVARAKTRTAFARFPRLPGDAADRSPSPRDKAFWHGYRRLTDAEAESLAREIVVEVRRRGPFTSLSDFVNRRLSADAMDRNPASPSVNACGALEAALGRARVNASARGGAAFIARGTGLPGTRHWPDQKSWSRSDGFAGVLSQGDLLREGGAILSARSDVFRLVVRAEVPAGNGVAVCALEAVVRRSPAPLVPDATNPREPSAASADLFGRRLEIVALRELR